MTKKILGVALAVLMLLVVAFPVSAATEVSKVEMRGTVANGTDTIVECPDIRRFLL